MENTETIYKVGDKVWSPAFGWGEVVSINEGYTYAMRVYFKTAGYYRYTHDGRFYETCPISLFFTEQRYSVERPAWQPKQGDWCWFWDYDQDKDGAALGKFERMDENNYKRMGGFSWRNCAPFTGELPPHLKE